MPTMSPDVSVSVIVPLYNEERFVRQCLASIVSDPLPTMEVLVVNDGSTDGSAEIAREVARGDSRVRVIDKPNGGYGSAMNRGLDEARGMYVGIVEPDDFVDPGTFTWLMGLAAGEVGPDVVKAAYWRVVDPDTPDERTYVCQYAGKIKPPSQRFRISQVPELLRYHPSIWSAVYRRGFLEERGIRFREFPGAGWADNPFLFETMCQAESIVYDPKPHYHYRDMLAGSSSDGDVLLLALERWNDIEDVLDRLGIYDDGIRESAVAIGIAHIRKGIRQGAMGVPVKRDAIDRAFERMPYDEVMALRNVPKSIKLTYCEECCVTPPADLSDLGYHMVLAREFAHSVRMNGPRYAMDRVAMFLRRRKQEREQAH